MSAVSEHRSHTRHRLLRFASHEPPGRSPRLRRVFAELTVHRKWIERKPGAMWDAVPAASRAALAR